MVIDVDGDTLHAVYIDDGGNERDDFTIVKGSTLTATTPNDSMAEGGADSTAFSLTRDGCHRLSAHGRLHSGWLCQCQ